MGLSAFGASADGTAFVAIVAALGSGGSERAFDEFFHGGCRAAETVTESCREGAVASLFVGGDELRYFFLGEWFGWDVGSDGDVG